MTGSIYNTGGKQIILYRSFTENADLSETEYLAPTVFQVGVDNEDPVIGNTSLIKPIPISYGTVCDDGSNTMTGSSGGDDTTDNTTTYKAGGATSDVTGQNLIANSSNATKVWTISDLASAGANADATKYTGLWIYIIDATALAKFLTSGTCLEIRIGADSTTNYYSKVLEVSDLAEGWNWISDNDLLSAWTENGTPGTLNDFQIRITTNNATDTFVAGDVVYDLFRQWTYAESIKLYTSGYPSLDMTALESTTRAYINTLESNGFLVNSLATLNEDTSPIQATEDTFTGESKSVTDELVFVIVDRVL